MMTKEQAMVAGFDELTDELAAAGWDSTQQTVEEAREAVLRLIDEVSGAFFIETHCDSDGNLVIGYIRKSSWSGRYLFRFLDTIDETLDGAVLDAQVFDPDFDESESEALDALEEFLLTHPLSVAHFGADIIDEYRITQLDLSAINQGNLPDGCGSGDLVSAAAKYIDGDGQEWEVLVSALNVGLRTVYWSHTQNGCNVGDVATGSSDDEIDLAIRASDYASGLASQLGTVVGDS